MALISFRPATRTSFINQRSDRGPHSAPHQTPRSHVTGLYAVQGAGSVNSLNVLSFNGRRSQHRGTTLDQQARLFALARRRGWRQVAQGPCNEVALRIIVSLMKQYRR